jgi:membrane-associated phospholipid phosphatase
MALIFWNDSKFVRWISLIASITFGASVLLGHLHYSIDVFAAFFITYAIYHISQKFFAEDFLLFNKKIEENS